MTSWARSERAGGSGRVAQGRALSKHLFIVEECIRRGEQVEESPEDYAAKAGYTSMETNDSNIAPISRKFRSAFLIELA